MTMGSSCFWSLLSLNELKFIYIPSFISDIRVSGYSIRDLLLHHSLFEFMHPNEIALARSDLSSFLKLKALAGSVTRCRFLSFASIAKNSSSSNLNCSNIQSNHLNNNIENISWDILDLVIYTATDDSVLVFFHNTASSNTETAPFGLSCCQGYNNFFTQDAMQLNNVLKQEGKDRTSILPLRIFQIVDQRKGIPLFIWPPPFQHHSANVLELVQNISKDIVLKEFKSSSFDNQEKNTTTCTRHFYATGKVIFIKESCLFQRILIPYGNVFFESFQVSPVPKTINTTSLYLNYYKDSSLSNRDLSLDSSKTLDYSSLSTDSLVIGEVETQIPMSLPLVETQKQHLADTNVSTDTLFQKFRVHQQADQLQNQLNTINISSSVEKKRRLLFDKDTLLDKTSLTITTNMQQESGSVKVCARCRTSNSPEWRRGPDGHKTLCNACGLRYSRFRTKQWRKTSTTPK